MDVWAGIDRQNAQKSRYQEAGLSCFVDRISWRGSWLHVLQLFDFVTLALNSFAVHVRSRTVQSAWEAYEII
jgi:hypothetical protein